MPCANAGNLAEALVRLARQLARPPTVCNSLETVTLRDCNNIHDLILLKHRTDLDGLLEQAMRVLDLVRDAATIDLDLHEVRLLLLESSLADLGVGKNTDNRAVLADALELARDGLSAVLRVLLGVASEGLLLGSVPVLVEATLKFVGKMRRPYGSEGAEATGSLNVANDADDDHWWCLDDGDSLDDLALVHLCEFRSGMIETLGSN